MCPDPDGSVVDQPNRTGSPSPNDTGSPNDNDLHPISETEVTDFANVKGGETVAVADRTKNKSRLSVRSASYDYFNRGELDDTQRALMTRDNSGRGYLRNEELYDLMRDHRAAGSKLVKYRTAILA